MFSQQAGSSGDEMYQFAGPAKKRLKTSTRVTHAEILSNMMSNLVKVQQAQYGPLTQVGTTTTAWKTLSDQNPEAAMLQKLNELDKKTLRALHSEMTSSNDVKSRLLRLSQVFFRQHHMEMDMVQQSVDAAKACLLDITSYLFLRMSGNDSSSYQWELLKETMMDAIEEKSKMDG